MFDGRDPIYLQIADQIRSQVLSGALGEEEQVMSTTQYATTYRINPATAAKAFGELIDEGVVYKRRGVGMFVSPGARDRLVAERRERFFADVVDPLAAQARVLGIPVDDVVGRLRELDRRAAAATATATASATATKPTTATGSTTASASATAPASATAEEGR